MLPEEQTTFLTPFIDKKKNSIREKWPEVVYPVNKRGFGVFFAPGSKWTRKEEANIEFFETHVCLNIKKPPAEDVSFQEAFHLTLYYWGLSQAKAPRAGSEPAQKGQTRQAPGVWNPWKTNV